ncbi:hypothetical protein ACHAXH_009502 [Discostella pseudostelligera]
MEDSTEDKATTHPTIGNFEADDDPCTHVSVSWERNPYASAATTTLVNGAYSAELTDKIIQQQQVQEKREMQFNEPTSSSLPLSSLAISPLPSTTNKLIRQNRFHVAGGGRELGTGSSRFLSGAAAITPGTASIPVTNSWSWSEQFFYSQDDQSVDSSDHSMDHIIHDSSEINGQRVTPSIGPIKNPWDLEKKRDGIIDDETCNNTVQEARQRSNKAHRASTVGAFVIFLKALFGIGMLSNPKVMGEVGLLLGTFCHLLIVVGCAFACYLLLSARQIAKMDILASQRRGIEQREDYEMWRKDGMKHSMEKSVELERSRTPQTKNFSRANQSSGIDKIGNAIGEDIWDVVPVPLSTVVAIAAPDKFTNNSSCGNVHLLPLEGDSGRIEPLDSKTNNVSRGSNAVSDEYQSFTDNVHNNAIPLSMPPPPKQAQVRLVTYGDVANCLVGKRASFFVIFAMVMGHLMFASGMLHLAIENLCYVAGWERLGWSYVEVYVEEDNGRSMLRRLGPSQDQAGEQNDNLDDGEYSNQGYASRSTDEEEYYLEWKGPDFIGRLAMASLLFPIIHGLLQIPSLTELAAISSFGLITYAVGCIGSMLYAAVVLTDGHPFLDRPDDMWTTKWSGVPTYVATTIYCIEGINLALPTVNSIEGTQRWGGGWMHAHNQTEGGGSKKDNERQHLAVLIVVGGVFMYGLVTLLVSWIGLAGGLGGGVGTMHGEDGCWDVTYCLNSSAVRYVYMLSLGVALVLTLPVILYPSTQMLEIWLDERNDERQKKIEAGNTISADPMKAGSSHCPQRSILPDDETVDTASESFSQRPLGIDYGGAEMRNSITSTYAGKYIAPACPNAHTKPPNKINFLHVTSPDTTGTEKPNKVTAKRKVKYWKLRMLLAFIICVIGTLEGSFPSVLKASEVIRGVCLSVTGLIVPPLLYMSAVGGDFSAPMAAVMALLIGLGLFNIVLVLMSVFGSRDFIVEEGRGNFYDM